MPQGVRLVAPEGVDVAQDRVLVEVEADQLGQVGVDQLVVGHAVADGVGDGDPAAAHRRDQPGDAEHRVAAEVHRVEELVVDPAVDDVDRLVTGGRAHPHLAADADQVAALDELDAHHPGQQGVLEVGRVEHPGGEDDDGGVARTVGGRGPQGGQQHPRVVVHRADPHRGEGLGEDVGHRPAVGDDIADAAGHPHVVLEHPEGALLVTDQVDACDVHAHPVGGPDAHDRAVVVLRAGDQPPRDDALVHRARDLALARVDVVEERLQRRDPLDDTGLDDLPLVGRDDPRHGVEREGPLLARVVEGDALVEVGPGEGVGALLERGGVHRPQGVEDRLVRGARCARLGEHLVPGHPERVVAEQAARGVGFGRLAHVTNLWPGA